MKITKKLTALLLVLIMSIAFAACSEEATSSTSSPSDEVSSVETVAKKKLTLNIKNLDKETSLNIETTGDTLYDALIENKLISGEKGQYGFFVTSVNGVTADGSDGTYWTFRDKDGEFFPTGVETTQIKDGDVINIVRE